MSNQLSKTLTAAVWQHMPSNFSAADLVVMLKIAGLTRDAEGFAFPSTAYLAAACGFDRRYLMRILRKLKRAGVLKIGARKGHSSRYFIQLDALRALPLAVPAESSEQADEVDEEKQSEPAQAPEPASATPTEET